MPTEQWQRGKSPAPGFSCWTNETRLIVCADRFETAIRRLGWFEDRAGPNPANPNGPVGRGPTAIVDIPDDSEQILLRPLRHGGWLGPLLSRRFVGTGRPLDELRVTARLREAGAPVPEPVCVLGDRAGAFWNTVVGTRFEPGGCDAGAFLRSTREFDRLRNAAAAAGHALKTLHDLGGSHRDLHLGNLVWFESEQRVLIVDFDRARIVDSMDAARRMRELMRLYRSLIKQQTREPAGVAHVLFDAYVGDDVALGHALRARLPLERVRLAIHRVGYRNTSDGHSIRPTE